MIKERREALEMYDPEIIKETVAETLVEASTTFREDQVMAYGLRGRIARMPGGCLKG